MSNTENNTRDWYQKLKKPRWAPKTKVFGIVWSILYPIILVSFSYVLYMAYKGEISWVVTVPFIINFIANLIFTPIQFSLKNNGLALLDIIVVWATIIWLAVTIWPIYPIVAYAQIPYFIWVSIATVLQTQITFLNRKRSLQ